jgi:hypothetical protein
VSTNVAKNQDHGSESTNDAKNQDQSQRMSRIASLTFGLKLRIFIRVHGLPTVDEPIGSDFNAAIQRLTASRHSLKYKPLLAAFNIFLKLADRKGGTLLKNPKILRFLLFQTPLLLPAMVFL